MNGEAFDVRWIANPRDPTDVFLGKLDVLFRKIEEAEKQRPRGQDASSVALTGGAEASEVALLEVDPGEFASSNPAEEVHWDAQG